MKINKWVNRLIITAGLMSPALTNAQSSSDPIRITANEFSEKLYEIVGEEKSNKNVYQWPETDSVRVFPEEIDEFQNTHLPIITEAPERFPLEEAIETIKQLIEHIVNREIEEFNRPEYDSEEVFNTASNPETWKPFGEIIETYKGNTPYTVVLIPQAHFVEGLSKNQLTEVNNVQEDIYKIMEKAYEIGPVTSSFEGFQFKEQDKNIPTFGNLSEKEKTIGDQYEEIFDKNHPSVQSFGLADLIVEDSTDIAYIAESLLYDIFLEKKTLSSQELLEIINWENDTEATIKICNYIESLIQEVFETPNVYFSVKEKLKLLSNIEQDKNRLTFDSRNNAAVKYIQKLGEQTNPAIIVVKYGKYHFVPKHGKTIQESLCKKHNTSYVIIKPRSLK